MEGLFMAQRGLWRREDEYQSTSEMALTAHLKDCVRQQQRCAKKSELRRQVEQTNPVNNWCLTRCKVMDCETIRLSKRTMEEKQ